MIRNNRILTRMEVLEVLAHERARPDPSETVILACEVALRKMKPEAAGVYTDKTQPEGDKQ